MFGTARAIAIERFDRNLVSIFCDRSQSESTRRNYRQVIDQFFAFHGGVNPSLITSDDVTMWRDHLTKAGKRPATIVLKLAVVRSFYEYLRKKDVVMFNPACSKMVATPEIVKQSKSRTLSQTDLQKMMAGPDQSTIDGARDYALLLTLSNISLRLDDVCALRVSSIYWTGNNWIMSLGIKKGKPRVIALTDESKTAIDNYLRLDEERRRQPGVRSNGAEAFLFQPVCNYRTLEYNKPLTTRMVRYIVKRWAEFASLKHASPRDAQRVAVAVAV